MTAFDLFCLIDDTYGDNPEEFVYNTHELLENIKRDSIMYEELVQLLLDYCDEKNICPMCGQPLEINVWQESRGEYFGTPAYEMILDEVCSNSQCMMK